MCLSSLLTAKPFPHRVSLLDLHDDNAPCLRSPQDALVRAVLSMQPQTVVVLHCPGAVLMPWAGNATTILAAFVPGQADGAAITVRSSSIHRLP